MQIRLLDKSKIGLDHELIWGSIGLVLGLAGWLWPVEAIQVQCLFKAMVGIPCPTCGMTRSAIALRSLDVAHALTINPLITALLLFCGAYVLYAWIAVLFRTRRIRIAVTRRWEPTVIRVVVVLIVLGNWVYLIAVGR